jgi:hypothetical protein
MSTPALCQLDDMLHLKPNWDSYGAKQIDIDCIRAAKEILRPLNGRWQAVPMSNGGVQLEKHSDGIDIEITICRATLETTPVPEICAECGWEVTRGSHGSDCSERKPFNSTENR